MRRDSVVATLSNAQYQVFVQTYQIAHPVSCLLNRRVHEVTYRYMLLSIQGIINY